MRQLLIMLLPLLVVVNFAQAQSSDSTSDQSKGKLRLAASKLPVPIPPLTSSTKLRKAESAMDLGVTVGSDVGKSEGTVASAAGIATVATSAMVTPRSGMAAGVGSIAVAARASAIAFSRIGAATTLYDDVLEHNTVVAYYGNPNSRYMGILGQEPIREAADNLEKLAGEYNALNGTKGVVRAFEIVYGTVYADADIGYVSTEKVMRYIHYAQSHGMVVVLDHQLGKYSVEDAIRKMLPFLKYPCVDLAIDPEWKTLTPGKDIGAVDASDINTAQQLMQDYMIKNHIPGKKILVVHQFNYRMIVNRQSVRADYPRIELVLNADGFGPPALKYKSWDYNVQATNIPLKGFKLFFPKSWKHTGYDDPLMTPAQVMKMTPQPVYISYQ